MISNPQYNLKSPIIRTTRAEIWSKSGEFSKKKPYEIFKKIFSESCQILNIGHPAWEPSIRSSEDSSQYLLKSPHPHQPPPTPTRQAWSLGTKPVYQDSQHLGRKAHSYILYVFPQGCTTPEVPENRTVCVGNRKPPAAEEPPIQHFCNNRVISHKVRVVAIGTKLRPVNRRSLQTVQGLFCLLNLTRLPCR